MSLGVDRRPVPTSRSHKEKPRVPSFTETSDQFREPLLAFREPLLALRPRAFHRRGPRRARAVSALAAIAVGCIFGIPGSASAAASAPGWTITQVAQPTNFTSDRNAECASAAEEAYKIGRPFTQLKQCDTYQIVARNEGGSPIEEGSPTVISDVLPAGLVAVGIDGYRQNSPTALEMPLACELATLSCTYEGSLPETGSIGNALIVTVAVEVAALAPPTLSNTVSVVGGGAPAGATNSLLTKIDSAAPAFGLTDFSFTSFGDDGTPDLQAADHPNAVTTNIQFPTVPDFVGTNGTAIGYLPVQDVKDIAVDLPLGMLGNPQVTPRCPLSLLHNGCPTASVVGRVGIQEEKGQPSGEEEEPIFNLVPEQGYPAEFGFHYLGREIVMYANVVATSSGYRLRVTAPGIPRLNRFLQIGGVTLTFFGNPAVTDGNSTSPAAFFTNPMNCAAGPLKAGVEIDSWQNPNAVVSREAVSFPNVTGCDHLQFHPAIRSQPDSSQTDSPTGYSFELTNPQTANVAPVLATAELRTAEVALPDGLVVSPSAADGLLGCAAAGPAGINLGSGQLAAKGQDIGDPEATELGAGHAGGNGSPYDDGFYHLIAGHCPAASTLGTAEVVTPVLPEPLKGHVYLGRPDCLPCGNADAQSGRLLKLYLELAGSGVIIKLPGSVSADPATGRLVATFRENPQFPFESLKLNLKSGPRSPLTTPPTCGSFQTTANLEPWSAPETPNATPSSGFSLTSGPNGTACANSPIQQPNDPAFTAGTLTPIAGSYSPFALKLSREDGSQRISSIDTTLPEGLVGKLAGIPYCSDAAIAAASTKSGNGERSAPSCPITSEVGTVNVGAGSGPSPFYVQGHAYLAGPYKGAPLSLAIITPAVAGPFDLGTVVVRTALYVNETTAQIHAVSDPIPSILAGIPLDIRSVALNMNKPNFTLNPTSCDPMAVLGSATSTLGNVAALSSPFQVGACNALAFKPKLSINLKGGTKRNKNPALTATVTYPKGAYANIAKAAVTLPHSEFLDQSHIQTVCTRVQFAAKACPQASIYGHARAITPLLDDPVEGPVYLRSSSNKLPDLVAELNGQIDVVLDGKIDTGKSGGIRNTFNLVPDAPVAKFTLKMKGGERSLLVNSENICKKPQHAVAAFTGQNGKSYEATPLITNSCAKKARKGKRGRAER